MKYNHINSATLVLSLFTRLHVVSSALPRVDYDRMGKVGLVGAFAGLDWANSNSSLSLDSTTSTLLSRSSDGSLTRVGSTNAGGSIAAGCALDDVFYVAGEFSSFANTGAQNIASYKPSSNAVAALGSGGPNGRIHAIFCDTENKQVWVGGNFTSPASLVAVWHVGSSSWSAPPFGGLSGADVLSISTNSSQSSLLFAGSFITSFQGNGTINGTNNPNVPFSSGASPYSSSLVPVPLQNAQIDASPSSTNSQFSNIQNVLCPTGDDGPGHTWFSSDGSTAVITVRAFSSIGASGIRLGNTFLDGRGTTGFTLTTIPDNRVQTLTHVNPSNGQNETCSQNCPLLTDSSVLYQDFLFSDSLDITGFQLRLSQWQGSGSGLHILQLLSSGAFANAVAGNNAQSCYAPSVSNVTQTGTWTHKQANTGIAGTQQTVLVSTLDVGTPKSQSPSFTWMPYVSASGQYEINLLVPGCNNFQDCALRTSVEVTVFPGGNQEPWVTKVSQTNTEDATRLIYQGTVVPSSPNFVATITMTLSDDPEGSGQNGRYELIADRVQLVLTSPNIDGTTSSGSGVGGAAHTGFGVFEWPLSSKDQVNASSALPNTTQTALDVASFDLYQGLGANAASSGAVVDAVVQHPSGTVYLGGSFTLSSGPASGATNVVAFQGGALVGLPDKGLNGRVSALLLVGSKLFVGGRFTDTPSGSQGGALSRIAVYDIQQNQWSSLGGGVNGEVTSLGYFGGKVQVTGNFTQVYQTKGVQDGSSSGGFAVWDVEGASWVNSGGFLSGSVDLVVNGTVSGGQAQSQFIAGNLASALRYGASGFVTLATGDNKDDLPDVKPLDTSLSAVQSQTTLQRRESTGLIPTINFNRLFKRQSTGLAALPESLDATSPAVLAGAFWTNSSSNSEVAILGGNFSLASSEGLAAYDFDSESVYPLPGASLNGIVRTLFVRGDDLYIGGEFTIDGTNANGFAVYNLALKQWDVSQIQPLISSSGPVVVRSISAPNAQKNVIVAAGTFENAGSLSCHSICSLNTDSKQWNSLGNGISGDVSNVLYAGSNQDILVASGSLTLSGGSAASVAIFTFSNSSWAGLGNQGDLPGPVTAVEVNNGNASSIFAAGRSNDGSTPFLSFWNGLSWTALQSTFKGESNISQLTMVPVLDAHSSNGIIESDRMLMVSGSLSDSSFGDASSALFDGQTFLPYIVSTSGSGSPGAISGLIHSFSTFSFSQRHFLAVGIVILISIAIAAGVVFLLALLGILWTLFSRRDDKLNKHDGVDADEDESIHQRPSSLLAHVNAATRTTIMGGSSPFSQYDPEKEEEAARERMAAGSETNDPFGVDASNYMRAETPLDAIIGAGGQESGRPAHARYSFDGTGEGELALTAGMELEILDDRDQAWWYARDPRTMQEGVVPAAYLY